MNSIYIATRLYNTDDKIRACRLENHLLKVFPDYSIFMPYRDVNEDKILTEWKKTIFLKDIEQLNKSDFLIGFWDGTEFDEGIGFEIGYAIAKGKNVIILNSDFIEYTFFESRQKHFMPDPLFSILNIHYFRNSFHMRSKKTYQNDLISSQLTHFDEIDYSCLRPEPIPITRLSCKYDRYFETGASRYFQKKFHSLDSDLFYTSLRFASSDSFLASYNDFEALLSSKEVYIIAGWPELCPGSSVITGVCYALNIPYYIINDRAVSMIGMVNETMPMNLMIDEGCHGYIKMEDLT